MDKGYDFEELHRQIREEIGADSVIPVRTWKGKIYLEKYRQQMYVNFDSERYREREKSLNGVFSHQKKILRGSEGTKILVPSQGDQDQNDPL